MKISDASFRSPADELLIHAECWSGARARAALIVAHGMAEHSARYRHFGEAATAEGFVLYALDHRGHGRSVPPGGELGDFGAAGWDGMVEDLLALVHLARSREPLLPLGLLGHSMGSFIAQQLCLQHSKRIDALVLSGSASFDVLSPGAVEPADADGGFSLTSFNAAFEPARTPYDWLSRDPDEVDKYIADPLCGFPLPADSLQKITRAAARFADPEPLRGIRADLPVLSLAGDADPINDGLESIQLLEDRWRAAGVQRFDRIEYPGGRHEMLNETNRDEVTADLLYWLKDALGIEGR